MPPVFCNGRRQLDGRRQVASSSYQADRSYTATGVGARGAGWIAFAAVILGFAGTFNVIDGIVALSKSKFYVAGAVFVFSDLRTWGWIVLLLGIVQIGVAFALFAGSQFARWFGIIAASINRFARAYQPTLVCGRDTGRKRQISEIDDLS